MIRKPHIFLVEDDQNFGSVLKAYLEMHDFETTWNMSGKNALVDFSERSYDLCILDIMLPAVDGFTLAKDIRKIRKGTPIIFLTAKTLKEDILKGYELGADDYITKPFDSEVLLCKIRAILRRNKVIPEDPDTPEIFVIGKYRFDFSTRTLHNEDSEQKLSPRESELLKMLCQYKNEVLPRDLALRTIWGDDNYFTTRSMDVFVSKLRKYLSEDPSIEIRNVHGSGYRLMER